MYIPGCVGRGRLPLPKAVYPCSGALGRIYPIEGPRLQVARYVVGRTRGPDTLAILLLARSEPLPSTRTSVLNPALVSSPPLVKAKAPLSTSSPAHAAPVALGLCLPPACASLARPGLALSPANSPNCMSARLALHPINAPNPAIENIHWTLRPGRSIIPA